MEQAKHWGLKVKKLREMKGWTQRELAEKSGVPESHISKIENAKQSGGSLSVASRLSRALGVSIAEFFPYEKPNTPADFQEEWNRIKVVLPVGIKVYANLAEREGGQVVRVLSAPRKSLDDESHLFGVELSSKWLPLVVRRHSYAIIDDREVMRDGSIVVWQDGQETKAGVYRVMGHKTWAENVEGESSINNKQAFKVSMLMVDVSEGLA